MVRVACARVQSGMKWIVTILCLLPGIAFANDWDLLRGPDTVALVRHALAPGTGDPPGFTLGDCATQRNLDERGRAQARALGAEMRARGITFDAVYASQWCRARETAELMAVGPVVETPALNSFFGDFSLRDSRTATARDLLAESDGRVMLVSHQVNISALTGQSTRSGEVLIARRGADGLEVLGSVLIAP